MSDFITRREQYLAYIAGESDTYPDEPITREETFLAEIALRIASGGTGGSGGVGILKIQKTSTNGLVDTYTITYTDNTKSTFTVTNGKDGLTPYIKDGNWWIGDTDTEVKAEGKDGKDGINGIDGKDGEKGDKGDKGDQGIQGEKGEKGDRGPQGIQGPQGEQGIQGIQGEQGEKGDKGDAGADGKDGTNGKDGADGKNGENGKDGADGKDGTSVTVSSVSESTVDGGFNVVTFSDGKTLNIKNGNKGADGKDGAPGEAGYTPVKGVDYFDGVDGEPGKDGAPGTDGKNGVDGKNAYQYAQDGGYTGSETEFSAKLATPFVTPQMFKAPTDKDDTAALQRALAASDTVYLPSGQYVITETIDLTNRKSLVGSDNQGATLIYDGVDTDSVVLIGLETILRNINIKVKKAFKGAVLDTNNLKIAEGTAGLNSKVEHVTVTFEQRSPEGTLIQILVDSGSDVNNMPAITGVCYQTYNDVYVSDASRYYGTGIKILLVQNRAFTEEAKQGFPWVTHVDFDDVYLGQPYTAIKAGVDNRSGTEYFNRINIGHVLFNNVYTQYYTSATGDIRTRYFFDVEHIEAFLTKCIAWDYHHIAYDYSLKANRIGEGVNLSLNDCEMNFGVEFLESCDFTAETDSGFTVEDSPSYFTQKYFKGTFLRKGYDSVDAKIDAKLASDYIGNVAEDKVNEILYSGYANVLENPLTQVKVGYGWSSSAQAWVYRNDAYITTIIIPVVKGGNIIRWASERTLSDAYNGVYFFNEDLTTSKSIGTQDKLLFTDGEDTYLKYDNPSGYPYASIVFAGREDISSETMMMTINREITGESGESFTEYLKKSVIVPAIEDKFAKVDIPTSTSQLTNDSGFITAKDIPQTPDLSGYALKSNAETWTFTLADGSTVTKKVVLA